MKSFDCWKYAKKFGGLTTTAQAVMAELACHFDDCTGDCKVSLSELASGTAASKNTVIRHLVDLEEAGYIRAEKTERIKTNYWLKNLTEKKPKTEADKAKEEKFEQAFESFINEYPSNTRPVKRSLIKRKFRTHVRSDKTVRLIMTDLRERKERDWDVKDTKFIMDAQNYLAKEAWLDEAPEPEPEYEISGGLWQ